MARPRQVALCATCLVDQVLPEVGVATVKLLRRTGCRVDFPSGQTCCGQPFFNSGFRRQAIALAQHTIEIFEDADAVVLPGGSCTSMITVEYPQLLAEWPEWHERARALAEKTFELSQFLVHQAPLKLACQASAPAITYHDSCHMCRHLGVRDEPRRLLREAGCTIREMRESDRCCGFGGLFSLRLPEVSNAMTSEKLRQAEETGGETLITSDPGCLLQMRALRSGTGMRVEHLAILLEELTR